MGWGGPGLSEVDVSAFGGFSVGIAVVSSVGALADGFSLAASPSGAARDDHSAFMFVWFLWRGARPVLAASGQQWRSKCWRMQGSES